MLTITFGGDHSATFESTAARGDQGRPNTFGPMPVESLIKTAKLVGTPETQSAPTAPESLAGFTIARNRSCGAG